MTNASFDYGDTRWPREFLEDLNPNEQVSYVKSLIDTGADPDPIRCFVRDGGDDDDTMEEDIITGFCRVYQPSQKQKRTAWLDDRQLSSYYHTSIETKEVETNTLPMVSRSVAHNRQEAVKIQSPVPAGVIVQEHISPRFLSTPAGLIPFRQYDNFLSFDELHGHLAQQVCHLSPASVSTPIQPHDQNVLQAKTYAQRFGHKELPDADRRLIYVSNIQPAHVQVLAETAVSHQVSALRTALYSHLGLSANIEVIIHSRYYRTFELHFHMPFYVLRNAEHVKSHANKNRIEIDQQSRDVSFLAHSKTESHHWIGSRIEPAHISITICGPADRRWIAYALVDEDVELEEDESDYSSTISDLILKKEHDGHFPIWNPREYFLLALTTWSNQVIRAWNSLIAKCERSFREQVAQLPSDGKIARNTDQIKLYIDTCGKAIELIGLMSDMLAQSKQAWDRFSAPGGDIGFFKDLEDLPRKTQEVMVEDLRAIQRNFAKLSDAHQKLKTWEERYRHKMKSLQLELIVESNNTAKRSSTHAELMVYCISPPAIVSAVFAIPEPSLNIPKTRLSFAIATIVFALILRLVLGIISNMQLLDVKYFWVLYNQLRALIDKLSLWEWSLLGRRPRRQTWLFRADTEAPQIELPITETETSLPPPATSLVSLQHQERIRT